MQGKGCDFKKRHFHKIDSSDSNKQLYVKNNQAMFFQENRHFLPETAQNHQKIVITTLTPGANPTTFKFTATTPAL
jgi:hypothetical protein